MRFSEAFVRQLRDRSSIADYAGRKLTWHRAKSRPAAGDYWACCPFHHEKSPSFHVIDAKGVFKCFGCGESGDIFGLAMKLEGLNFPEAVARLADLAGMELPREDNEDRSEAERRKRLFAVMARAGELYAGALRSNDGALARDYLIRRGLNEDLWDRFAIGYAPSGWTWALDRLKAEGVALPDIHAAGLAYGGDNGRRPIDVFRHRITFAIHDSGGKLIAFGGRALAKDEKAKYINSPETSLFHKGRTLYQLKQAREVLARDANASLVVAEGYIDVIAFARAGIPAVAPLGTALTEDQLQLIWRNVEAPVMCFDGDAAGQRAADRALDLALPHFGPGRSLRIALLPAGEDPDDLFRRAGPGALRDVLAAAKPAVDALFAREQRRAPLDSPENRAAFKKRLKDAAARITDDDTRKFYFSDLLSRADALLRQTRPTFAKSTASPRTPAWRGADAVATPELRAAARRAGDQGEQFLRAAIDYPQIMEAYGEWLGRLDFADPDLIAIRDALLDLTASEDASDPIDHAAVGRHLIDSGEFRAAARLANWPRPRGLAARDSAGTGTAGIEDNAPPPQGDASGDIESEWLAFVTHAVVLPAIMEEMDELRVLVDEGDEHAFERFAALGREARNIEARVRSVRSGEPNADGDTGLGR